MNISVFDLAWIFAGGGIGSLLRWSADLFLSKRLLGTLPLATLAINLSGAFVFGLLATLFHHNWHDRYANTFAAFVMTGILGGYTTFSALEIESVKLWLGTRRSLALCYVATSAAGGVAAAFLGMATALLFF